MGSSLGALVVSLEANIAKFTGEMEKSSYIAEREARKTAQAFDQIKKSVLGLAAAAGIGLSFKELASSFSTVVQMESDLLKTANRLNTTTEDLSLLGVAARKTGMDVDSFYTSLGRMEKNVSAAALGNEQAATSINDMGESSAKSAGALRQMGLKADILNQLPLPQKLLAMAEAFQKNIDPADRMMVAMDLFGRGGQGMVNVLKEGPEPMAKWIARAEELGIITTDMAKRGTEAKTAGSDFSAAWGGLSRELVDAVAPAVTMVTNLITDMLIAARKAPPSISIAAESAMDYAIQQSRAAGFRGSGVTGSWVPQEVFQAPSRNKPGKIGGGGGGGVDAETLRLASIYDTITKDIAKLSEGSLPGIAANLEKTINQIYKKSEERAVSEAELEVLARQRADLQKKAAEEDYQLFVAKASGNTYAEIEAQARTDLQKYKGFAGAKEVIAAATARKNWEEDVKNSESRLNLQKSALEGLASETPFLAQQLALKSQILPLEIELARLGQEKQIRELLLKGVISGSQADELRGLQTLTAAAKKYSLERAKWATEGVSGGFNLFALELRQESSTALAFGIRDGLKGAKSYADDAITQMIMSPFTGNKMAFKKIGLDIATSITSGMVKMGTTKIFSFFAENAMGMVTTWQTAQQAMTAASLAGDAARLGSMSASGAQGISLLQMLAKSAVMVDAGRAAAATYASVSEIPVIGWLLAPPAAAAAFAATAAYAAFGGKTGSGETGGGPGEYSPGAYHIGGHLQPTYAHAGWPALRPHEVPFIGLDTERVLSPQETRDYEARKRPASGGPVIHLGGIHIDARGADKDIDWIQVVNTKIFPALVRQLERGRALKS